MFFVQGWGDSGKYTKETYLAGISRGDRRLLAVDYPREIRILSPGNYGEKAPIDQLQRTLCIIEAVEKKGIEKIDAAGYSQGGLDLALAAKLRPDLFQNLVFINPAGIIGKDSFWALAKRFVLDNGIQFLQVMKNNPQWKNKFKNIQQSFVEYVFSNINLAQQEVKSISEGDILEQLEQIKQAGIGVSFICSADDKVFQMGLIQKLMKRKMLNGFYSIEGGHGNLKYDKRVAAAISEAMEALDNRQK
jgi:hypothetical protein